MQVDHLIIGQGICGTFLSWYLEKAGRTFIIIDQPNQNSASRVAAGIINPITGRRMVKAWLIDEIIPFAVEAYTSLGSELGFQPIIQKDIVDFFPSPQMRIAFHDRLKQEPQYLKVPDNENAWTNHFNYPFGFGIIQSAFVIDGTRVIETYRSRLLHNNMLLEASFEIENLKTTDDGITYNGIQAQSIIFCDGVSSYSNPYFKNLPFAPNKGEVLWIECDSIPDSNVFKQGINLVPWKENLFWVGPSYEWDFENDQPTTAFREKVSSQLEYWLKGSFRVIDHRAALRPATLERRPFVGFHPIHKNVGILNGMGTKGYSLSPFFANQLVENIVAKKPVNKEADVTRFSKILSK